MKPLRSLCAVFAVQLLTVAAPAQTALDRAAAALTAGDLKTAESTLTPLTAGDQPDPAALHLLSQVRLAQKRAKDAVALAEQAAQLAPDRADYHAQLGVALSVRMPELGFLQQARTAGKMRKAFEKAVELEPQNLAALTGLARYHTNAPAIAGGSLTKAAEFARRVHALDPFTGEGELGRIAEHDEQFAAALAHYEAAAQLRPDAADMQLACGRLLVKLGRPEDARARLQAALKLAPDLEPARTELAATVVTN